MNSTPVPGQRTKLRRLAWGVAVLITSLQGAAAVGGAFFGLHFVAMANGPANRVGNELADLGVVIGLVIIVASVLTAILFITIARRVYQGRRGTTSLVVFVEAVGACALLNGNPLARLGLASAVIAIAGALLSVPPPRDDPRRPASGRREKGDTVPYPRVGGPFD